MQGSKGQFTVRFRTQTRRSSLAIDNNSVGVIGDYKPSLDERSHKLTTFAVESFGHLGVEGSYFVDQLAASVVGGRDVGSMARKGVLKERLLQTVSVTTQVALSRRVSRFKLQLRDRQEARRSQGGEDDRPTPMAWGWSKDAE